MIRLAVIGTGGTARAQADGCKSAGGAEFVACCDIDGRRYSWRR